MPLVILLPLLGALFMIILGVIVLFSNKKTKVSVVFLLLCISIAIWLIGTFLMLISKTDTRAIFWDRFGYLGVIFIPIFMYHFSIIFSNRESTRKKSLKIGYLISLLFVFLSRSSLFVNGVYKYDWGIHTKASIFHHIFLFFFTIYILQFYIEIYSVYKKEIGLKKEQAKYIFAGFVLMLFGALGFLPAYGINIYPLAYIGEILGAIFIAYAILRYRFMDITFVIGRGFIYLFSYIIVISIAILSFFLNNYLRTPFPDNAISILVIIIGVAIYPPVFNFFEKIAEKYFYYNYYSYKTILGELGKKINRVLEVDRLCKMLVETIAKTMHFDKVIVALNVQQKYFAPINNFGFDPKKIEILFENDFIMFFLEERFKGFSISELDTMIENIPGSGYEKMKMTELKQNMEDAEVRVCIPLTVEKNIVGVIILGEKIGGIQLTEQDMGLLSVLSSQASIAIENARHYSQLKNFNIKMEQTIEKRTEELRKANEKLKVLDKAKSDFVSIASHQLRSPLTIIKGYLSVILEGDYGKLPEEVKKPLKTAFDANEKLINFTNDLLDISRIESGKIKLEKEPTSLKDLVSDVFDNFKQKAKEKNLTLKLDLPEKELSPVQIDRLKFEQIIFNVIDNAIKYTPEGKIEVKLEQKDKAQLISIKDTGEGMDEKEIEGMFDKFERASAGKKHEMKGSGIGLYIAKQFIKMHGGKIWAQSPGIGKGSTFYIQIQETA